MPAKVQFDTENQLRQYESIVSRVLGHNTVCVFTSAGAQKHTDLSADLTLPKMTQTSQRAVGEMVCGQIKLNFWLK